MSRRANVRRAVFVLSLPAFALTAHAAAGSGRHPGTLERSQRVEAQRAIERVYHLHRESETRPFDEAVPEALLREKVEETLRQSAALERFWQTPITAEMLRAEMERMARRSRLPGRLRELFAALGDDPFLVQECLARPALAARLVRSFHGDDASFDAWWLSVRDELDASTVVPVADPSVPLPAVEAGDCADDTWANGSLDDLPDPRTRPTAVWTGTHVIVWGGYTGALALDTGGRYDPATDTWEPTSRTGAPAGRYFHSAVWTGTEMIVWGGWTDLAGPPTDTGAKYDPLTDTWTPTSTTGAPSARRGHTAVWTGSRMIVWGGYDQLDSSGGRYDPATDTWSPTSITGAPAARHTHTAVWTGTRMIVWGGETNVFPGTLQNTGGQYDPVGDAWTPTSTLAAPTARRDHTAVWSGTRMIVWGGSAGETPFLRTGGQYDPASDLWAPLPTTGAPTARTYHTAIWDGARMVVWGGSGGSGVLDSGGRFTLATNTWSATSTTGAPAAREGHAAVWTGSRMIVWGGTDAVAATSSGGRYDPASDSWTATSTGHGPGARDNHTAVWTGTHLIVWGGSHGFQYLSTGGRYDPALDDWSPTSTVDPPAPRTSHTAIWTGSRMIVWGGSAPAESDTGARYDPVADSWAPTGLTNAPAARRFHTAVWAGDRMIVWGGSFFDSGSGQTTYFDSGGRYDAAADAWTPTAIPAAASGRRDHTAVWTGTRMIVWGGEGAGGALGDGAAYDAGGDAWEPVATIGAPSARENHAAAWTGSEMIVWGGVSLSGAVNSGARYDPLSDTWAATDETGAPEARHWPTVVWTGAEMIAWGGWIQGQSGDSDRFLDDGGRYDPVADVWSATSRVAAASGRRLHTAAWTGEAMVVWGGNNGTLGPTGTGGLYCACRQATFYLDSDLDGFGDPDSALSACEPPAGYVADGSDCDDTSPGRSEERRVGRERSSRGRRDDRLGSAGVPRSDLVALRPAPLGRPRRLRDGGGVRGHGRGRTERGGCRSPRRGDGVPLPVPRGERLSVRGGKSRQWNGRDGANGAGVSVSAEPRSRHRR